MLQSMDQQHHANSSARHAQLNTTRTTINPQTIKQNQRPQQCLICMSRFTPRNPRTAIPCIQRCNDAPVHLKCIHEWQQQQDQGAGSCPLCRGALGSIAYSPPGQMAVSALVMFSARRLFCTRPIRQTASVLRCYVILEKGPNNRSPLYRMYVQAPSHVIYPGGAIPTVESPAAGDQLLLVGRTRWDIQGRCMIDMSLDRNGADFSRTSTQFMGRVESSILGLGHTVKVPASCTSQFRVAKEAMNSRRPSLTGLVNRRRKRGIDPLVEVAAVGFMQNRVGRAVGPRKMKVCVASLVEESSLETQVREVHQHIAMRRSKRSLAAQVYAAKGALRRSFVEPQSSIDSASVVGGLALKTSKKRAAWRRKSDIGSSNVYKNKHEPAEEAPSLITGNEQYLNEEEGEEEEEEEEEEENEETIDNMLQDEKIWSMGTVKASRRSHKLLSKLGKGQTWINQQSGLQYASNLEPYWLETIQAYSLDFHGRVLLPSNKNFQLVVEPTSTHTVALQFGKVCEGQKEVYTMDIRWPMTPLQSFGIVLASCARKIACA